MIEQEIITNYLLPIAVAYLIAWIIYRLSRRVVGRFMGMSRFAPESLRLREERQRTLHDLLSSTISFAGFTFATLFTLALFIDTTTLVWMVGLFSAAFGLGARPLISDYLTGISFIFEDLIDVGEKAQLYVTGGPIEGVIEKINLRTILLRAPTGELYIVPNGEVRVIRNFSRGRFSTSTINVKIPSANLGAAITLLEELGEEAMLLLPNLLEPWQVLNISGQIGEQVELTIVAKARFGLAAEMQPRLLNLVQSRLAAAEITLVS